MTSTTTTTENHINPTHQPPYMTDAIAVFTQGAIQGHVLFQEDVQNRRTAIHLHISGLRPNSEHGFHIHEAGDLTDKCTSMCAHYNPHGKTHGGPHNRERHVGDLGNIRANAHGDAKYTLYDNVIKLRGKYSIIGRGLVIHHDRDDLGQGGDEESLKTGNAGKRIACAIIGYSKTNYQRR